MAYCSEIMENILNFTLNSLLLLIFLLILFNNYPTEANVGQPSNKSFGEGRSSTESRFSEKRTAIFKVAHLAPMPWVSYEKENNDNVAVANKIILGRKMRGEIRSKSDRDHFYVEVTRIMNISFKLETTLSLLNSSSGISVTVYAEDQETILGISIADASKSGELNMGLLPGNYNILIERMSSNPFEIDLTYDLTVEPFCTFGCWNSIERFDRYSGEYDLQYKHESLGYTHLPNKVDQNYGVIVERSVIGEDINAFGYEMIQNGVLNVEFWTSGRNYGRTETLLQSIITVEIFKNIDGHLIATEKFNSISNELIARQIDVEKGTYLIGISTGGIAEESLKYRLKVTENENLDPPNLVGGLSEISPIPRLPTVDDELSLRIKGEFPASNAVIQNLKVTRSGSSIVVDMKTGWLGENGAQVLTPVDTTAFVGLLPAGDQSIILKVNGTEINRFAFEVLPVDERRRLYVVAKVGRRESPAPLRTRVDRLVNFSVYAFTRDDSSDMEIVDEFEWTVPSRLVGNIDSVGSLDITTVANVDEEIIFRVGDVESKFRVITLPGKAVEVVIDPPELKIEPGETRRFKAKAQDKFGNNVVRNFGWYVVGDIGTIDHRKGDFKAGNNSGEGWIIAVANTQLIFSDVKATLDGAGKVVVGSGTPQLYSLEQNTPNPFNPSTQISFQLPSSSHVRLTVFNTLGQPVEQLIDAPMNSGSHQVEWRSNDHRSGVYFYELRADPFGRTNFFSPKVKWFVARKKMLLVR